MSLVVRLSFGERFLNWYAKNTKLYIRGQKGKDWEVQRALDKELANSLNDWIKTQPEGLALIELEKLNEE